MKRLFLLVHDLFDACPIGTTRNNALWDVKGLSHCKAWQQIAKGAPPMWTESPAGRFLGHRPQRSRIHLAKGLHAE